MRRLDIDDRVTVREATTLFHHRAQSYTRGRTGVVLEHRPEGLVMDTLETELAERWLVPAEEGSR